MGSLSQRFAIPVVAFLAGAGLQVSGFEDTRVALGLWAFAGLWLLVAVAASGPVRSRLPRLPFVISIQKSSESQDGAYEFQSDNCLWRWLGGRDRLTGEPLVRAWCPEHLMPLVLRANGSGRLERSFHGDDRLSDYKSHYQLYCGHDDKGHTISPPEKSVTYGQLRTRAQQKAEGERMKRLRAEGRA